MTPFEIIVHSLAALVVGSIVVGLVLDFAAHVSRYRNYRRTWPGSPRARVWRYTR